MIDAVVEKLATLVELSVALAVTTVEFVSGEEVVPVSGALVWTDDGIETASVMEADMLAILDWLPAVLVMGIEVFVTE